MNRVSRAGPGQLSIRQFHREGTLSWAEQGDSFSARKRFEAQARSRFASEVEAGLRQRDSFVPAHGARRFALAYQKRSLPMRRRARALRQRLGGWTISLNLKGSCVPAAR